MTRRFNFLFTLTLAFAMFATTLMAQPLVSDQSLEDDEISSLTKDPKVYPPRPKDMWEIGVHGGVFGFGADTPLRLPLSGFAGGIAVRKSLGYSISLRGDLVLGSARGLDVVPTWGVTQSVGSLVDLGYTQQNPYVFNYKTSYTSFGIQAIYTLTNIKFHRTAPKLNIYGIAGFGGFSVNTFFDALNSNDNNNVYNFVGANDDGLLADLVNQRIAGTIDNRDYISQARDVLEANLDGDYETEAPVLSIGGNELPVAFSVQLGAGISYRLNDRMSIAYENQVHVTNNDYIDGRAFRTPDDLSGSNDSPLYSHIRLNFFLGDNKKQSIPLWWVNPLDASMSAIAANTKKKDAAEMLADKDNDGVPNLIDKEPDTPAGAEVDTRGVTLDSDKDGLPNHLDKEPYSPVGYKIDPQTGVSEKPKMPKTMTKEDVLEIGKSAGWDNSKNEDALRDWFLPMIHFDNDSYVIKSQSYAALEEVASVMRKYPSISVVVEGHASSPASGAYNTRLSYNRANAAVTTLVDNFGISRSRLVLTYNGETDPLIKNNGSNYMNRRVEFKVANGETEMSAPK